MKSLSRFLLCLLIPAALCILTACSTASQPASFSESPAASLTSAAQEKDPSAAVTGAPYYPVDITDFLGYTSKIDGSDRIVSITTSSTQILTALGAEDRIVGVDAYSEAYLPGTEIVGDYSGPDVEKIASLEPDLVIAANNIQQQSIDQLRALNIPVIAAEPTTWDQVPEGFGMIGTAVNNTAGAAALSRQLEDTVASVKKDAPSVPVSSYYVLSYGSAGNWTSGAGSFINTMMEYAGGDPITKNTESPWLEYPMEDLIKADPECIILGSGAGTLEDFMQTAGYEDLRAVKEGRVYEIDSNLVTIPSQGLNEGLQAISDIINEAAETADQAA